MKTQQRIKRSGEVFTPLSLVNKMLNQHPNSTWLDPSKTWFEPGAGDGNFLVEIKARLLKAGHDEKHILDNMIFSIELLPDNHWALQHRLGYLVNGNPNPKFWPNGENFQTSDLHQDAIEINHKNPYGGTTVLHHRNHVCTSALDYDYEFGRGPKANLLQW